jgi:uncharacterized phage infection (PIP) family protein YhgE
MRKVIFLTLGFLELTVALVLVAFGVQVPGPKEVDQSFERVATVTQQTSRQVRLLKEQVRDLRRPEVQEMAKQLRTQTQTVTQVLKAQKVDFDQVRVVSEALGEVASGMDGWAATLDAEKVGKLGQGLGVTADYLERRVAPAADKAADHLETATTELQADARQLSALLKETTPDLKAAREIYDSLGRFSEGLDKLGDTLDPKRFGTMREGFRGLETSLSVGAGQVEQLSEYTYPSITFNGLKPEVEQKKFWPEGDEIAGGLRKAAEGVRAAGQEMDNVAAGLPRLKAALEESRKVTERTRSVLGKALEQQDQLEALLKDIPERFARLAEELPHLLAELTQILRDTQQLKEVAVLLRQAEKGIDNAVARWPELRQSMAQSATLLRTTQQHLQQTLEHRQEYEAALGRTVVLAESFSSLLPLFTQQMETHLRAQETALDDLGHSIDDVSEALPPCEQTATRLVQMAKWLVWMVAVIVGLHGFYLLLSVRLGKQFSV